MHLDDGIVFPRRAVRFPIELHRPPNLEIDDPSTWPAVDGRVELVGGRLLYMPPCGDIQQDTAGDVIYVLRSWSDHDERFVVAGNEAGMLLDGEARGADAAVWRAEDARTRTGKFRRVPPILAVEIAGVDEGEAELRVKASWYLGHGVLAVWLVLPDTFEVVALDGTHERRYGLGDRIDERVELPGLQPAVDSLFAQISR